MQVIGMIGYVDKYDFVINLSKTINIMNKAVLVIDATLDQKYKYVIPSLHVAGKEYVTQYNGIDFAVGFDSMHDIENFMCEQSINIGLYDYILIDIDCARTYELFRTRNFDKILFFISSSILSVEKNREIVKGMRIYNTNTEPLRMTKIMYKDVTSRATDEYLNSKIEAYNVEWLEPQYEIPMDERDIMQNVDSQFSGIIDIKKHSKMFIASIAELTAQILGDTLAKEVIKEIKRRKD